MSRSMVVLSGLIVLGMLNLPAQAQAQVPPPPAPMIGPSLSPSFGGQPPQPPPYMPPATYAPPSPPLYTPAPPYPTLTPAYQASPPGQVFREPVADESSGWSAGIGLYFMQAVFQSNPAYVNGHTAANGAAVYRQTDFNENFNVAPLVWIGYTWDSGWGIRGRWFEYSGSGNASDTVGSQNLYLPGGYPGSGTNPANPGDPVSATSVLYCDVIDLEATYTWAGSGWSLIGSAGLRYVHLNQSYSLNVSDPTNGTTNVYSINKFDGAGPTVAIEGHYQLGSSHFGLYGSARGAIVVGEAHQWASIADPVNGTTVMGGHQTSVLGIGELELGAEWSRRLGRFRLYSQVGFVGQLWSGAGNASQALGLTYTNITPGSNLGFLGGVIRTGINF